MLLFWSDLEQIANADGAGSQNTCAEAAVPKHCSYATFAQRRFPYVNRGGITRWLQKGVTNLKSLVSQCVEIDITGHQVATQ